MPIASKYHCLLHRKNKVATQLLVKHIDRLFQYPRINFCSYSNLPTRPSYIVFSGIQPTGLPHLGNYVGALRQWVELQNSSVAKSQLYFSIVDLHAITSRQNPEELRRWKCEALATLLAVGLDPNRCTIFFQSDVSLKWLANLH